MKSIKEKSRKGQESERIKHYSPKVKIKKALVDSDSHETIIRNIESSPNNLRLKRHPMEMEQSYYPFNWFQDDLRPLQVQPCQAAWNSVLLFFNLADDVVKPMDYQVTTPQDALEFLDEGIHPATPTISEFMTKYWCTLSYGSLAFGINTPKDESNQPIIPTIAPAGGANAWRQSIKLCIESNAQQVWKASGSINIDGKRLIPSVVLVQHYNSGIAATFGPIEFNIDGIIYVIRDQHHMYYNLAWSNPGNSGGTSADGRAIWGRMCHEYAHNFIEFGDLYGPSGCTGYWDLHGDNSPSGRMSEVCSHIKERAGWLVYKQVIEGPTYPETNLTLKPYTTTGEAIKVVPDPEKKPHEYFLLEYRKKTGNEIWRPDGGLTEEGLLITHINAKMLRNGNMVTESVFLREAPFFDPEFADFSDNGGTLYTGNRRLNGILYPQPNNNEFTIESSPNSNFYGHVPSGLKIKNIQVVGEEVQFNLEIDGHVRFGWSVTGNERGYAGHFFDDPNGGTDQIFFRDSQKVGVLVHRQAQWLVEHVHNDWIGGWRLGPNNYVVIGDLDGDGFDEVYIRSSNWAGVLKWRDNRFQSVTVQYDWIDQWNLGSDNKEIALDVDGDGTEEIYVRSPNWAGIIKLVDGKLRLKSIQHDWIDKWNLGSKDKEWRGRFTQKNKDELLIRSDQWLGLLEWDSSLQRLKLLSIQHDWIDQWNLGPSDSHYIGDFDGDGIDEVYIRSNAWAGVFKWTGVRFELLWIEHMTLNSWDGNVQNVVDLTKADKSYAGRFLDDRDGILHRYLDGIAILHWRNGEMQVRHKYRSPFRNSWNLGTNDWFILGQFVRGGNDVGNPAKVLVQPNLTGIFIHNSWGTGSVGINYLRENANNIRESIELAWIQSRTLLLTN